MFKVDVGSQVKALNTYYEFKRAYSITWTGHFGRGFGGKVKMGVTRMGEVNFFVENIATCSVIFILKNFDGDTKLENWSAKLKIRCSIPSREAFVRSIAFRRRGFELRTCWNCTTGFTVSSRLPR